MATQDEGASDRTCIAGASFAASQYLGVEITSGADLAGNPPTVGIVNAATDIPYGFIQDKAASGDVTQIRVQGRCKVIASAAISAGALIKVASGGKVAAAVLGTDVTHYVVGRLVEASLADGDIVTADIDCIAPSRAV